MVATNDELLAEMQQQTRLLKKIRNYLKKQVNDDSLSELIENGN